ncbi:MAG: acetylxylan esterase [Armatimonadota bacterium]
MVFDWVCQEATAVSSASMAVPPTKQWLHETEANRREKWLQMLGMSPLPERTPLQAAVTGTLNRDDYVVEKLHFQSLPQAYVPGNLYRPPQVDEPLPAVLYLTGHTKGKVNWIYQRNPRWFGQHGYISLVLDPIQLGESQGYHNGTHGRGEWDWYSRGYTPAGVEIYNAMRALDYLQQRDDVDAERIGVTGLSGGGAMSWFLGAADERVKCVVPVCQTGSIQQLVCDRATDGHCDCAFWVNYYRWCTPDVGALIAPRPLLVAAGTDDVLWRPYAFREALHRIHRVYDVLGVPGNVKLVEDLSPHGYTPKLRKQIFEWFNHHLKGDDSPVTDDVTEFVEPEDNLLVFDGELPEDDRMEEVPTFFIPRPDKPEPDSRHEWEAERDRRIAKLQNRTFRQTMETCSPHLKEVHTDGTARDDADFYSYEFDTGDGFACRARLAIPVDTSGAVPILTTVFDGARTPFAAGGKDRPRVSGDIGTAVVEARGTGETSMGGGTQWTVRRACYAAGLTLPERQTHDLLAALTLLRRERFVSATAVYGKGKTAAHAIYAAVLDDDVEEIVLENPVTTHTNPDTPEFLGVLQIGDLPENLALVFPRPITFVGEVPGEYQYAVELYELFGVGDRIRFVDDIGDWTPA